jgi:uncharacterized protein (DUF2141 family)
MKYILFTALFVSIIKPASGQLTLGIEITGLKNDKGVIMLQLFDENEKVIDQKKGEIKDNKCIIIFRDLKPGKHAVRYFHDENLSGVMETNMLGIPKEGYGFSNNAAGPFGPKPFKEWLFDLEKNKSITIKTRY